MVTLPISNRGSSTLVPEYFSEADENRSEIRSVGAVLPLSERLHAPMTKPQARYGAISDPGRVNACSRVWRCCGGPCYNVQGGKRRRRTPGIGLSKDSTVSSVKSKRGLRAHHTIPAANSVRGRAINGI